VLGQLGAAFVVPVVGQAPDRDELRHWCKERLADYKAPDQVHLVDDLPLTSMSKIDKRALVERLATTGG
jgi:non-ribosomal peptide synthetase component E (peptide arylation enzyme)